MFESVMWQYIRQQQDVLLQVMKDEKIKEVAKKMKNVWDLLIVAHGSSYNAAITIAPYFEQVAGIHVQCMTPSQLAHRGVGDFNGFCIGISQTGTSQGVIDAIGNLKEKGLSTLAITNEVLSPLDQLCDDGLYLECGQEDSNAKTKGYSATCLVLMRLALEIGLINEKMTEKDYYQANETCREEISELEQVIQVATHYFQEHEFGKDAKNFFFIGDGIHFGTAMEGQIKLMETMGIPTMFNDMIELSHGMHRAINKDSILVFIDDGSESDLVEKSVKYFKNIGTTVLHISNKSLADIRISNYGFTHSLFSFIAVIQVLSVFVPELNGLDPNRELNEDYTKVVHTRIE